MSIKFTYRQTIYLSVFFQEIDLGKPNFTFKGIYFIL